jgi:outer membrane protein TolC
LKRLLVPPLLLCALSAAAAPGPAPAPAPAPAADKAERPLRRLGVRDLWQMAQQRFPGLQAARHGVTSAKYTHDEQKWLALPSGEFTTFLSWSPEIQCQDAKGDSGLNLRVDGTNQAVISGPGAGQPVGGSSQCLATNVPPTLNSDTISAFLPHGALVRIDARVLVPLFTFGKLKAARDLGKVGVDLAKAAEEISRVDLALNVVRAYYGLKTARAALETVRDGQTQIKKWVKRIDDDLESGKSGYSEIDLMRLKVAEAQVDAAVVDVERTIKGTLRGLRYFAQDDNIDIDDGDLEVTYKDPAELSYYRDIALVRRPEMFQLRAYGEGAQLYKKLRIAELLPDFAFMATFGYGYAGAITNEPNNAFMNRFNYTGAGAGLVMRWNLDFGPRVARLQKAQADLAVFDAKRREALTGVATEVERTFYDLEEARKRLRAAETAERRARGWYQGVKQAVDVGTAESRDMLDALRAYFDQHIVVLRAINDVNVMHATLRRQCGLDVLGD